MTGKRIRSLLAIVVVLAASCTKGAPPPAGRAALRAALDGRRPEFVDADGPHGRKAWDDERQFYEQNGYRLEWSDGRKPGRDFDELVRALKAADTEGLEPSAYRVAELEALRSANDELDLRATYAYLRYARDLHPSIRANEDARSGQGPDTDL